MKMIEYMEGFSYYCKNKNNRMFVSGGDCRVIQLLFPYVKQFNHYK